MFQIVCSWWSGCCGDGEAHVPKGELEDMGVEGVGVCVVGFCSISIVNAGFAKLSFVLGNDHWIDWMCLLGEVGGLAGVGVIEDCASVVVGLENVEMCGGVLIYGLGDIIDVEFLMLLCTMGW